MADEPRDPADVRYSEIQPWPQRRQLPARLVERVRFLRAALHKVEPMTLEQWLDGFERDADPEGEIAWFEAIGARYLEYESRARLEEDVRPVIYSLMVRLAMGMNPAEMGEFKFLPAGTLGELQQALESPTPTE